MGHVSIIGKKPEDPCRKLNYSMEEIKVFIEWNENNNSSAFLLMHLYHPVQREMSASINLPLFNPISLLGTFRSSHVCIRHSTT